VATYRLTRPALRDLEEIFSYLTQEASDVAAERIEAKLFAAFDDLARLQSLGHRRLDVRRKDLLFHVVSPCLIAFRRERGQATMIIRVLHGKRNVAGILR
jgi:plasmid stabilization system protein ParE